MLRHAYHHRITIQEQVHDQGSDTGDITSMWVTVELDSETELADIPAEVLTGPGREPTAGDAKWSETSARVNCPWFPGLRQDMRVLWDGRTFDILSIETDASARREYRLRLKGGLTDGD